MGKIIDQRPSPRSMHRLRWWGRLVFTREDEVGIRSILRDGASDEHTLKIVRDELDGTVVATWEYEARGASRQTVAKLLDEYLQVHDVVDVPWDDGPPDNLADATRSAVRRGHVFLSPRGHTKKLCDCPGRGAFECRELSPPGAEDEDINDIVLAGYPPAETKQLVMPQPCTCGCGVQLQGTVAWRGPAATGWVTPACYVRLARERMRVTT